MVGAILGLALTLKSDSEYQLEQEDLALKESNIAAIRGDIVHIPVNVEKIRGVALKKLEIYRACGREQTS